MTLREIRMRRKLILLRIAQQRSQVEQLSQALKPAARLYDQGHALAQKIRQYPMLSALAGALVSILIMKRSSWRKLPLPKLGLSTLMSVVSWWQSHKAAPESK